MNNLMGKDWPTEDSGLHPEELGVPSNNRDSTGILDKIKIPEVAKKENVFDEVDIHFPKQHNESDY